MYIHTYLLNYQDSLQLYPSLNYGNRTYDSLHVYKDEAALPPILHTHQEHSESFHFSHKHYICYNEVGFVRVQFELEQSDCSAIFLWLVQVAYVLV